MAVEYLQSSPGPSQKEWVVVNSNRNVSDNREQSSKTGAKLLFNEAVPACASNRATCVDPPASIVIEKLLSVPEEYSLPDSTKSSFSYTALSEESLNAAVKLAKRDLRRRHLDLLNKSPPKHTLKASLLETSDVELLQALSATPSKAKLNVKCKKKERVNYRLGSKSNNQPTTSPSPSGQSPPTRENHSQENNPLDSEIHRLQHELEVCIKKAEDLASREKISVELLEPDEQSKLNIRKQKQAARSASIIYALQQQVKELQENLQGNSQKIKPKLLQRLAAAHRGALRALHGFIQQLSDTTYCTYPPNFKDLGQLIRQLCLCSAKVELNKGSAVPQSAVSILQKLETLDSCLSKQAKKMQVQACPPPRASHYSTSITASQGPNSFDQAACKPVNAAKNINGKKKVSRKNKSLSYTLAHRRHVLRAGVERLAQQREQANKAVASFQKPAQNEREVYPEKVIPLIKRDQAHSSGFLQPTVSSKLRVNHLPEKEQSVPWIPTSPHCPPRQRPVRLEAKPEPRCLFPPDKSPQFQFKAREARPSLNSEIKRQVQDEAMRRIWLDKMTRQRLKDVHQLNNEENQHHPTLRSKEISPTQWADGAEQKATENIQPLLDEAQQFDASRNTSAPSLNNRLINIAQKTAESAEQLSEALLEDLLEDTARAAWAVETDKQLEGNAQLWTQRSTLENMLLRMEEIQRDQEEVRRRVTSIIYSDPLNWNKSKDNDKKSISRPCSPQPIRLTVPVLKQSPAAEIILGKPLETGVVLETTPSEEKVSDIGHMFPVKEQRSKGAVLSVPTHTLRSIRHYWEDYEAYCCSVALKTPGGVTPWAIADSLAEELLAEALTVVAAEFQDVVEEYAEAVFTSEFLQPLQSPVPTAQTMTG